MNLWCCVRYQSEESVVPEDAYIELPWVAFGCFRVVDYAWLVFRATFASLEGYLSGFTAVLELDTLVTVHLVGLGKSLRASICRVERTALEDEQDTDLALWEKRTCNIGEQERLSSDQRR
jgi:hypothetical protein